MPPLAELTSAPAAQPSIPRELLTEELLARTGQVDRLAVRTDARWAKLARAHARTEASLGRLIADAPCDDTESISQSYMEQPRLPSTARR